MAGYPRKIHVVTAGYLRLFTHNKQVEVIDRVKRTKTLRKPENVGHRRDYWGPDPETARDAEGSTAGGEKYALEVLQELPQRWPLRGEDRSIVAEFLALHFVRSPAFSRPLEDIETNYGLALSPRRRVQIRLERVAPIASLMACMQWSLVTFDAVHVGTCDQPEVPVPRLGMGDRLPGAALPHRGFSDVTEIRFAVSPRLLLLLTWLDELGSTRTAGRLTPSSRGHEPQHCQSDRRAVVRATGQPVVDAGAAVLGDRPPCAQSSAARPVHRRTTC